MAILPTATFVAPKTTSLFTSLNSKHFSVTSKLSSSSPRCCSPSPLKKGSTKSLVSAGIGFLAASIVALSPQIADATRIEYYATVAEPSCELNFVPSGLGYCDVSVGPGEEAPYNELVNVHYTARFADGTVFDSTYKRARPLTMRIGVGKNHVHKIGTCLPNPNESSFYHIWSIDSVIVKIANVRRTGKPINVIRGLDQGIIGGGGVPPMQIGGKRKLRIPPELAYGPEPAGCFSGDCNIPGNATLLYDINLVEIYSGNRKLPTPIPN